VESCETGAVPAAKEPANLILQNGKCPDSSTLITWSRSKPMVWDVTVPDTNAESHIGNTATGGRHKGQPGSGQQNRQAQ